MQCTRRDRRNETKLMTSAKKNRTSRWRFFFPFWLASTADDFGSKEHEEKGFFCCTTYSYAARSGCSRVVSASLPRDWKEERDRERKKISFLLEQKMSVERERVRAEMKRAPQSKKKKKGGIRSRKTRKMGRGERPELAAPPDVFYNDEEARKYTTNSRMIEIQVRLEQQRESECVK